MKKLVVSLAVLVSSLSFGQYDSLISNMLDVMDQQQELINMTYDSTYMSYKYGDEDAQYTLGILKTIFDDDTSRFRYGQINSRILKLVITDAELNNVISFEDWLETFAGKTNFEKYIGPRDNFLFKYGVIGNTEYLTVIDKSTNNFIFYIAIYYNKFENPSADNWINLGSIAVFYNQNGEH